MRRLGAHFAGILLAATVATTWACKQPARTPPNVLIISIDDLNDWVSGFAGHPQALTPNIDRLAARGVRFDNAHCQAPVCNPSRASMGVSLYPSTTGIYFLNPDILKSEVARQTPTYPHHFQDNGYKVSGAGKLFHHNSNKDHLPNWAGNFGGMGPLLPLRLEAGTAQPQFAWRYRLMQQDDTWRLQTGAQTWEDLYEFTLHPQTPADYDMANYYVSTHPDSRFVQGLVAHRLAPEQRLILIGDQLTEDRGHAVTSRRLDGRAELADALIDGLGLPAADVSALLDRLVARSWT